MLQAKQAILLVVDVEITHQESKTNCVRRGNAPPNKSWLINDK